ncbi:MAG: FAD-dependent monooxygenase [Pseudomonadota bacterium]
MARTERFAIAGAGIAGLTAALALTQRGVPVRVYERRSADAVETGAGLQLSPNAMHALDALDLADAIAERASEPTEIAVREGYFGAQVAQFPLGAAARRQFGAPYLQTARQDLRAALLDACRAQQIDITCGVAIDDFATSGDRLRLTLDSGTPASADALIVADGVHSRLVGRLGGDMPRYAGFVAWRAVIDIDRLPVALRRPITTLWLGDGAHVVTYPIADGRKLNLLACVRREQWRSKRWSQPGERTELERTFRRWHRDVRAAIAACDQLYVWALHHREPLERWYSERVVAMGDACHPMLPFAAQGAAQAIEDALVLAQALTDHDDPTQAFAAFQRGRENRVRAVFEESAARAGIYHRGPVRRLLGFDIGRAARGQAAALGQIGASFDWLYGYDVTTDGAA